MSKLEVGAIVYFDLKHEGSLTYSKPAEVFRAEFEEILIGRIEVIDADFVEVVRAEDSPSPFSLENLPEEYKPTISKQSKDSADIFRIHKDSVRSVITDVPYSELKFSETIITSKGKLARLSVFDKRGKKKTVIGRVLRDIGKKQRLDIRPENTVPKVFAEFMLPGSIPKTLRFELNSNGCQFASAFITDANRSNLEYYQQKFKEALKIAIAPLDTFRREKISSVAPSEKDGFTGFTYENSFFTEGGHIEGELIIAPGDFFLHFSPSSTIEEVEVPQLKTTIYGAPYVHASNNKHKRDKLEWFSASRYPGLEAFLGFARDQLEPDKKILNKTRDSQDMKTVFTDILEGYFNPKASSQAFIWFRSTYLWMYLL
jgi:hypothetical protein